MENKEKYAVDILFSKKLIQKKISEVALRISDDFRGKEFLLIAVLDGSFIFCADLVRDLNAKFTIDFISLKSYSSTQSQGGVKVISGLKEDADITNKNILIVEDIVDTGITLNFLIKELALKKPKDIKTCVLLDKKCARKKEVPIEYSCFEVDNDFIVGYGLDCNGLFRGLPYIGKLKELVQ
jgi:hypoxanthine phosphoribosyltransferase